MTTCRMCIPRKKHHANKIHSVTLSYVDWIFVCVHFWCPPLPSPPLSPSLSPLLLSGYMLEPDPELRPTIWQVCEVAYKLRKLKNPVPNVFVSAAHTCSVTQDPTTISLLAPPPSPLTHSHTLPHMQSSPYPPSPLPTALRAKDKTPMKPTNSSSKLSSTPAPTRVARYAWSLMTSLSYSYIAGGICWHVLYNLPILLYKSSKPSHQQLLH